MKKVIVEKDTLVLNDVELFFLSAGRPRETWGGDGFEYQVTVGLTDEHIKGLEAADIKLTYMNDDEETVSRVKPCMVKDKETGEKTTLHTQTMKFSRTAKSGYTSDNKGIPAKTADEAINPIKVYMNGEQFKGLVGNGSKANVEFGYRDKKKGKGKKLDIFSIEVTDLVEVSKGNVSRFATSEPTGIKSLDDVRASITG